MNRGRLFRRPKLTPSCSAEGKEGRRRNYVLYSESLSLSLKEKYGLRVFGNRVLKGIFGSKG
jgi:hypothetical protein